MYDWVPHPERVRTSLMLCFVPLKRGLVGERNAELVTLYVFGPARFPDEADRTWDP